MEPSARPPDDAEDPDLGFTYRIRKGGEIEIRHRGRVAATLRGRAAADFLAEALVEQPLRHTRVWLACTGCEEVQHYGAIDFLRRHRDELVRPAVIAFEMLGCAGPSWLTREGIVVPFHADPGLVCLAETIAAFADHWHPRIVGELNGQQVKLTRLKGEFIYLENPA